MPMFYEIFFGDTKKIGKIYFYIIQNKYSHSHTGRAISNSPISLQVRIWAPFRMYPSSQVTLIMFPGRASVPLYERFGNVGSPHWITE